MKNVEAIELLETSREHNWAQYKVIEWCNTKRKEGHYNWTNTIYFKKAADTNIYNHMMIFSLQ